MPENGRNPVWFNRRLVPFEEASIHILTHSNNYGTSVFEGIRVYDTSKGVSMFHLEEHIDRLIASADKFGIIHTYTKDEIIKACLETVKASGQKKGYIRPQLQFGLSTPGLGKTNVIEMSVFFWPMGNYRSSDSLKIVLSDIERISPKSGDIEAKVTGFYTNSHFNYKFAHDNNADDAVMLDVNGNVAEVSSANIFFVKDGKVITPKTGYILKGITRKSVITIAKDELNLTVKERIVTPEDLASADEIFLTGTAAQIDSVTEYNGKPVGNGAVGAITKALKCIYNDVTMATHEKYLHWHKFI
ncbi:branched-chain amino acid aminotransferase [Vibrio tasmaniensis]|nr:branched-chain amino acid aminotransferase [Vibrio tasmaniensis]